LIGDPPNVLIATAAGLSFNDFLTHSLPIIIVVWLSALFLLKYSNSGKILKQHPQTLMV